MLTSVVDCDGSSCSSHPEEGIFVLRVSRWYAVAGITAGLLGLTVPASAATGWTVVTPPASTAGAELHRVVRPFRHRRLGGRRAKRQCGPGRAELEWHCLVVDANPGAVGHPPTGASSVRRQRERRMGRRRAELGENTRLAVRTLERHGVVRRHRPHASSTPSSTSARRTPGRSPTSPSCSGTGPRGRSSPVLCPPSR